MFVNDTFLLTFMKYFKDLKCDAKRFVQPLNKPDKEMFKN